MKATGIVRRIDDLGRVVVPKEIRRTLRIREGDPLEIYTLGEGEIVLKKYSPMGEMWQLAERFAEVLAKEIKGLAVITDRDQVIASAGTGKKNYEQHRVSKQLEEAMNDRARYLTGKGKPSYIPIVESDPMELEEQIICTILSEGEAIGAVILYGKSLGSLTEADYKLAAATSDFLGGHLEIY